MTSTTSSQSSSLQRLRAAVIDRRAESVRYRQKQLQSLHGALREQAQAICAAIGKDSPASTTEVEAEFFLTMNHIRHFYSSLDNAKEVKEEYLITTGVDNTSRRVGVGLVVIRPTTHTRFYSILCPVATAIAAGNCVLLEVGELFLKYGNYPNKCCSSKTLFSTSMPH